AGFIAWENRGSSNIGLSAGALGGAMLLFGLQLLFQLRGTDVNDFISTEYTIDRATPQIRTWDYKLPGMAARFGAEAAASEWLAKISPQLFDDTKEQEKLTVDMTVFSLLAYFGNEMRDWQTDYRTYRGSIGILMTGQALSTDDECGKITEADLQR